MNHCHPCLDVYQRNNKDRTATVPDTPFLLLAKRFHKPLGLDVLLACTASKVPEYLVEELKRRGN